MVDTPLTTRRALDRTSTLPCTFTLVSVQEPYARTTTLVKIPVSVPVQAVLPEALSRVEKTPWTQSIPRTRSKLPLRSSTVRDRDMVYLLPCRESIAAKAGLPGLRAPPGREPHADQETTRPG